MNMTKNKLIFTTITATTAILIVLGFVFTASDKNKINWLSAAYDISRKGDVVFVKYNAGKPEVYQNSNNDIQLLMSVTDEEEIVDIAFTPDDQALVFVSSSWKSDELYSVVSKLELATLEVETLFEMDALVTELAFDPNNEGRLYYLKAETFENYSPIAQEHPHGFDIFTYELELDKHSRQTEFNKYSMTSLQVSSNEEAVYVQMDDDFNAETADEIFETKQRAFKISLEDEVDVRVLSNPERKEDVYDFAVLRDENALVFQAVSNIKTNEAFTYELFYYDREDDSEKRLTHLSSYVEQPIITENEAEIYFIVDESFGKNNVPARKIYSIDMNGENLMEVTSEVNK